MTEDEVDVPGRAKDALLLAQSDLPGLAEVRRHGHRVGAERRLVLEPQRRDPVLAGRVGADREGRHVLVPEESVAQNPCVPLCEPRQQIDGLRLRLLLHVDRLIRAAAVNGADLLHELRTTRDFHSFARRCEAEPPQPPYARGELVIQHALAAVEINAGELRLRAPGRQALGEVVAHRLGDLQGHLVARTKPGRGRTVPLFDVVQQPIPRQLLAQVDALGIESLGVVEDAPVPVGARQHHLDLRVLVEQHLLAVHHPVSLLRVVKRGEGRHRRVVPHELLQVSRPVLPEQAHVLRVAELVLHALAGHVGRAREPEEQRGVGHVPEEPPRARLLN
mmetsp:Transcript_8716/g.25957  ORF Transcript_8716/g.25957 Transcript_8716/m.25957 type:complete len:334 (-) Transcript_8716:2146-3147(-)